MRRTVTALGLSLAIPLGALTAPLVHAHPDALTGHHRAHEIHAHVGGHSSHETSHDGVVPDGARLDDHDAERAVSLQWFVAVAPASFDVPAAVVTSPYVDILGEAPAHNPLRIVHGHDPPLIASTGSRAPPVLPS
jgi:hypothetical protein